MLCAHPPHAGADNMHHCVPGEQGSKRQLCVIDDHQGYIVCVKLGESMGEGSLIEGKSGGGLLQTRELAVIKLGGDSEQERDRW